MCELLRINVNVPTDICFNLTGLVRRGGGTGLHKDGWDIAFCGSKGCYTSKDPQPSLNSSVAKLVQDYSTRPCSVITHIHQANRGEVALENTHPFIRELWGCNWTYAHDGQPSDYRSPEAEGFCPVGETDSEKASCRLPHKLAGRYPCTPGNMTTMFKYIAMLVGGLREKGVFNMLLSDGYYMMAFCSTSLFWIMRHASLGTATLLDQDVEINFSSETTPSDMITVIATRPLTGNEIWQKIMPDKWASFCLGGRVV